MLQSFFQHANWLAILVSAVAFFALGSLWFSVLFGSIWSKEVEKLGIGIKDPKGSEIAKKMLQTFFSNFITAFAMSILVYFTGVLGVENGIKLGLLCGVGFAATSIITASAWESRSFRLVAIDFGYPVVGITICGLILTIWK